MVTESHQRSGGDEWRRFADTVIVHGRNNFTIRRQQIEASVLAHSFPVDRNHRDDANHKGEQETKRPTDRVCIGEDAWDGENAQLWLRVSVVNADHAVEKAHLERFRA